MLFSTDADELVANLKPLRGYPLRTTPRTTFTNLIHFVLRELSRLHRLFGRNSCMVSYVAFSIWLIVLALS